MKTEFFPQRPQINPTIYAYLDTHPQYQGLLKIGYTTRDAQTRVAEQYPITKPGEKPYQILLEETAIRNDGSIFSDREIHHYLCQQGIPNPKGEWFKCSVEQVKAAILALKTGKHNPENRTQNFALRPEQNEAIEKTIAYFNSFKQENSDKTPHFLWNAKMRFGKTFAAYQLAKRQGWKKLLILTSKPAVQSA